MKKNHVFNNTDEAILDWLRFINSKEEEGMRMLAKKNEDILEAYDAIKIASMSREARMAYEARMAEIMDIRTREFEAKEEGEKLGREKGKYEEKLNIAKNLLDILDNETIALKNRISYRRNRKVKINIYFIFKKAFFTKCFLTLTKT